MYSKPNVFGTGPTKLAKIANDLIYDKSIKNILEIGCGQGRDSIFFAEQGYSIETFDISENAIKFVNKTKKSSNLKNLNAIVHDVMEPFSYPNNFFHFVYSNLALQFFDIDSLKKIFNNIYRVMIKESTILFSTKKKGDKYYNFGTKISTDATSSFFTLHMNGFEPERYYEIILKTEIGKEVSILEDNYYFKIING